MQFFFLFIIRFYQRTLSPDHSPWGKHRFPFGYCKFTPSCSAYAASAIQKHGSARGAVRAVWRILRCNPWNRGGKDYPA